MPLFGEISSPYDESVEKVTAEICTSENWALILDICDRVCTDGTKGAKMCLLSIKKRLNNRDPHVVLLALSLLDSVWGNCGISLRREVSSREFCQELESKATSSNQSVGLKTRSVLKKWAENECKEDASLGLVETLYKKLVNDGHSFEVDSPAKPSNISMDQNVVQSHEEEEAIARAIALSLDDSSKNSSTYPTNIRNPTKITNFPSCIERDVRALYDFEAAEDNELTFKTGDIITVTDDTDANWWRGRSERGYGLFPSSFVTLDLKEPKKSTEVMISNQIVASQVCVARIDGSILAECLKMLEDCDPTGERPDPAELQNLECQSLAQGPLIDARLAEIDRQHNALAQVDIAIRDVLALYDQAVQQGVQYPVT